MSHFVLIPTDFAIIRQLREDYGRKVVLCYPGEDCREEYRARFLARGNSESFLKLFIQGWDNFLGPVRDYGQGVHIVMGPREHLTDLISRLEEERRADTTDPVDNGTIRDIEETAAEQGKDLVLYLPGGDEPCFYPIWDLDAPDDRWFLDRIVRAAFERTPGLAPLLAPKKIFPPEALAAFTVEDPRMVLSFVEDPTRFEPKELKMCPGEEDAGRRKRWKDADRREQIIYHRPYNPKNYPQGMLMYFSHLPVSAVRQLVAEGLLDFQYQRNESPSVGEMLKFCSGEDENIWFFHGFTIAPDRLDGRVALEGFESFTAPAPERREEFLRFNCRGETEIAENGACWCWYD